jgi:hypothetical protein
MSRYELHRMRLWDNKHTRTIPALVMPAEAEDIDARAIPSTDTSPATATTSTPPASANSTCSAARPPPTSGTSTAPCS